MERKKLPYLLPMRSVIFLLIFLNASNLTGKELGDISNWWTIVATIVNIFTIILLVVISKRNGSTYWDLMNYKKERQRSSRL
jgi:O-antigen/teichoic acid export membrane protein